jgi:acyl-CoA synthetase (AMP-forming)/AMP-acid ligase II
MTTVTQALARSYQEIPDQVAIHLLEADKADQPLTYRHLFQRSMDYAQALDRAGINPGEVVIIILDHGEDLIYAFFGAVLHGAVPSIMPFLTEKLIPEQYRRSLAALFEVTTPTAVITYPDFVGELKTATIQAKSLRAILISTEIQEKDYPEIEQLAGLQDAPEDIVLLQHSSGTTGLQKGVALSHRAVVNQLNSYSSALVLKPDDVVVSWLPLYHDMGLIAGFILPILCRIPLVLMSPFDWVRAPYKLMAAVTKYRGTLCWLPNFAYNFCAQKIRDRDLEGVDLSTMRAFINCSEPIHWTSHQMFLERFQPYGLMAESLATSYAMAENVFAVTQGGIDSPVTVDIIDLQDYLNHQTATPTEDGDGTLRMLTAGRAIENTHLRIIDADGADLPDRHIGEIAIQSDCMLSEYYHRPDVTKKAFSDGWYLTGDLGYLADGELYVTGRQKDLIIVGGKNIYPQDIERLAADVPGIHPGRLVAFGVFNVRAGTEDVVVVAESEESMFEKRQQIADEIRGRVTRGSDVALRYVKVVDRGWLLKTSSGKIARAANRDKYLEEMGDA